MFYSGAGKSTLMNIMAGYRTSNLVRSIASSSKSSDDVLEVKRILHIKINIMQKKNSSFLTKYEYGIKKMYFISIIIIKMIRWGISR